MKTKEGITTEDSMFTKPDTTEELGEERDYHFKLHENMLNLNVHLIFQ